MITREEYDLLKHYRATGYGWIARDKNGDLYAFKVMPTKFISFWSVNTGSPYPRIVGQREENILTCVNWEDGEPTKINDLIRDYESHQVIVGENMNKAELTKEIEDILDDIAVSDYQLGECDEDAIWTISSITIRKILSAVEKHNPDDVKVKVPSFVADWIEEVKALERPFKLEYLFDTTTMPDDVYDWLDEQVGDTDILARAWLDGYEVAEESLYYALIKGHELMVDEDDWCYWNLCIHDYRLFPSDKYSTRDGYLTKMSKDNWIKMGINDSNADFVKVEGE